MSQQTTTVGDAKAGGGTPGLPNIREHTWQQTHFFSTGPAVGSAASAPLGLFFSGGACPNPSGELATLPPPLYTSRRAWRTGRCGWPPTSVSVAMLLLCDSQWVT